MVLQKKEKKGKKIENNKKKVKKRKKRKKKRKRETGVFVRLLKDGDERINKRIALLLHVALPISQHTRQSHIARFALVGYAVPITSSAVERAAGEGVGGILIFFVFFFFPALVVVFSFIFKHTSFSF